MPRNSNCRTRLVSAHENDTGHFQRSHREPSQDITCAEHCLGTIPERVPLGPDIPKTSQLAQKHGSPTGGVIWSNQNEPSDTGKALYGFTFGQSSPKSHEPTDEAQESFKKQSQP
ncbi:hypothetical protein BTVI_124012 [Pitangus sulphuratus]|nr:hypothetical protein BTVI_124012 [Pitangus sulphuratus]